MSREQDLTDLRSALNKKQAISKVLINQEGLLVIAYTLPTRWPHVSPWRITLRYCKLHQFQEEALAIEGHDGPFRDMLVEARGILDTKIGNGQKFERCELSDLREVARTFHQQATWNNQIDVWKTKDMPTGIGAGNYLATSISAGKPFLITVSSEGTIAIANFGTTTIEDRGSRDNEVAKAISGIVTEATSEFVAQVLKLNKDEPSACQSVETFAIPVTR